MFVYGQIQAASLSQEMTDECANEGTEPVMIAIPNEPELACSIAHLAGFER